MQQYVYELYLKYSREPMESRINLARIAYRKTEEQLQKKYNSWDAFNGVICLTLMCLSGDGNLTYNEYELFKKVSNSSPTYDQLMDTAMELDYELIVNKYRVCGQETLGQALVLCAIMFACKGSYGSNEKAMVNALSRY
jgi:hypothetical protein